MGDGVSRRPKFLGLKKSGVFVEPQGYPRIVQSVLSEFVPLKHYLAHTKHLVLRYPSPHQKAPEQLIQVGLRNNPGPVRGWRQK